ncbi:hypothetical protein EA772_15470 [Pedobacter sp. G11]|uniref:hypothetical protein n=1 Tax=Pedobacter sp. G11 TaxID=2482728 RepID=UPI000F5F014B|nr:hypothetical protein [Pedobacter sp. G11]AZI26673.1 hypothetical protein EA772_15470 [Pedobacter sp. G11]
MKKILFVEDDDNKIKEILGYLRTGDVKLPKHVIEVKKSYQTGLNAILENQYDLILLDMSMYTFDKTANETGGEFMQFAGEDILKEMIWNDIITKTIIVTQYDIIGERTLTELKESWQQEYAEVYLGTVFYSVDETNWEIDLTNLLKNAL